MRHHDQPGQQGDQVMIVQPSEKRFYPPTNNSVTGVILAGGKSRRMEGRDKALVAFRGRPLIEHVLDALKEVVCEVIINTSRSDPDYIKLGYRLIADSTASFDGPLMGILVSMKASKTAWIQVVPCDMPLIKAAHLRRLMEGVSEDDDLVVAHDGDRMHPLLMCVRTSLAPGLARFLDAGGRKVEEWIRMQSFSLIDFSDDPKALANLNSQADFLAMESSHPPHPKRSELSKEAD